MKQVEIKQIEIKELFTLEESIAKPLLENACYPWEVLSEIGAFILNHVGKWEEIGYIQRKENVWAHPEAVIAESAYINGPALIGKGAEIRHCAFIRGNAIVGDGAVVGNSTELKNVILFNKVQVPHYNYVGDSILGYKAHMGAGAITSNVKSDKKNVVLHVAGEDIETGIKKIGAMIGDNVEVGCGSILNPGSIVGKNTNIYPLSLVRTFIPENSIYKVQGEVVQKNK